MTSIVFRIPSMDIPLWQQEIRLLHELWRHPSVEEIKDRKKTLQYRHVAYRMELPLRAHGRELYMKLIDTMAWADAFLWQKLPRNEFAYPEVEYIVYEAKGGIPGSIEPHVDNHSAVTIVILLSDPSEFTGGVNCFASPDSEDLPARLVSLNCGDAVLFRGEKLRHWITPVTQGRRVVLQIEYPGASSSTVTSEALMELAATLQCWQKLRQRCVVPPPEREKVEDVEAPEPRQKESVESVAGLLSELRSRLKSLPALTSAARGVFRSVQPGHLLLILGGFCRLFGRAADNADLAVQRCLKAAQATLEGPTGTTAICIIIFPIFGLLGQRLRSWQQRLAKWQAAKAAEKVHFSDMVIPGFDVQTCSSHQSVPMLLSSGMMPQTPTPQYQEERKPHGPGRAARHVVHGAGAPPARRGTMRSGGRVMTPPRPRRLQLDQLGEDEDGEFSTDGHEPPWLPGATVPRAVRRHGARSRARCPSCVPQLGHVGIGLVAW
ncbi:unnamed protein product [Cladocopium goreaui]|uniref:Fe2OG dioxygenase domain-containing protein n=1 Tax=Cladocopium goreaui TaxID=2562237 RepID=A0A9P1CAA3_9DINO|nr:unnamed protein product [Cladocopium goreaui]